MDRTGHKSEHGGEQVSTGGAYRGRSRPRFAGSDAHGVGESRGRVFAAANAAQERKKAPEEVRKC
jgi:hypothetical protein